MHIRTMSEADVAAVVALAVEVFGPFHEESFRPAVGEAVFADRDANWRQDYADQIPQLEAAAVAVTGDGMIAGFVAWKSDGDVTHVAVSPDHRRGGLGRALCEHAFDRLREAGVAVATIGTGGDGFHEGARALYESLGCTPFPLVTYYREL